MPQLFSPKFVDLVRVTTSTQGTGPLVCGPAVLGHATFTESIAVGDSFYYSVQGVDKPQEREVGRGTLLSNGTITTGYSLPWDLWMLMAYASATSPSSLRSKDC